MAALAEHQELEISEARTQLEEALRLEAAVPAVRADAAAGRIRTDEVDARIGAIQVSVSAAQDRLDGAERLSAELIRRSAEAGRAAVEAMLADERESLTEAATALAEAEELAECRRSEYELAAARYRRVERDGDALLGRYDPEHAKRLNEMARRKEEQIRWALRQPRMAIKQLPLDWQAEAYDRYDRLQDEAAAHRNQVQERRDGALVNPRDATGSEIRL